MWRALGWLRSRLLRPEPPRPEIQPAPAYPEPLPPVDPPRPRPSGPSYAEWIARTEPTSEVLRVQAAISREFRQQPLISLVVPVYRVPVDVVQAMVDSVLAQTYANWELCLTHGDTKAESATLRRYLSSLSQRDARIKVRLLDENLGIAGNSNAALELVTGEWTGLLDHDDTLAPFALYEVVQRINEEPEVDLLYSDKDSIDATGGTRLDPLLKPQWSPEFLLAANYLTHFTVVRTERLRAVRGWRAETEGAQDWDLFLRVVETGARVAHIPKMLYHWRILPSSVASGGFAVKPYAARGQWQTLNDYLSRRKLRARSISTPEGIPKIRWDYPETLSVSIVLVSDKPGAAVWERAREIAALTEFGAFEVVTAAPDVETRWEGKVHAVATAVGASLAQRLRTAVQASTGQCVVFLDDAVEVRGPHWLHELVAPLQIPEVGVTGPKLMDEPTQRIVHAGIVFHQDGTLAYPFAGEIEQASSLLGASYWYRNYSAVAGACFAMRREVWDRVGGFSERPAHPRLDIDLCLRVQFTAGRRVMYNPFARFFQRGLGLLEESGEQEAGAAYVRRCLPGGDPYFHPDLVCREGRILFRLEETDALPEPPFPVAFPPGPAWQPRPRGRVDDVIWFLPELTNIYAPQTWCSFSLAEQWRQAARVRSTFAVLGDVPEGALRARIARLFPALADDCGLVTVQRPEDLDHLPLFDAAIVTGARAVPAAAYFPHTRDKLCYLQEDATPEVRASYRHHWRAFTHSPALRELYEQEGGAAYHVAPWVDEAAFFLPRTPSNRTLPANTLPLLRTFLPTTQGAWYRASVQVEVRDSDYAASRRVLEGRACGCEVAAPGQPHLGDVAKSAPLSASAAAIYSFLCSGGYDTLIKESFPFEEHG